MGKDNSAETAFGLHWQEKAGMPKGLIMPQNKRNGMAGEKCHREDFCTEPHTHGPEETGSGAVHETSRLLKPGV